MPTEISRAGSSIKDGIVPLPKSVPASSASLRETFRRWFRAEAQRTQRKKQRAPSLLHLLQKLLGPLVRGIEFDGVPQMGHGCIPLTLLQ
jgi:hypothetical protein